MKTHTKARGIWVPVTEEMYQRALESSAYTQTSLGDCLHRWVADYLKVNVSERVYKQIVDTDRTHRRGRFLDK